MLATTAVGRADAPATTEPDATVVWAWIGRALRPVVGWILTVAGVVVIGAGWWGVSGTTVVAKQIPYLISGGVGGVGLILVGGFILLLHDARGAATRIEVMEEQLAELHRVLLIDPSDVTGQLAGANHAATATAAPGPVTGDDRVALANGRTFHRPDCSMVRGKGDVEPVDAGAVDERGLRPCKLCTPTAAPTAADAPERP